MPAKPLLGIFFGYNSTSIVQAKKKALDYYLEAPHSLLEDNQQGISSSPDDIRLIAIIQKLLRENKIENAEAILSLPAKDIILRTFSVPLMSPLEVKGVVEFEARRYIPFRLEELSFSYYIQKVKEPEGMRLRIVFVGIKQDILEKYCAILEQAGLKINAIEPSPISLLRLLTLKKLIQNNQKTALIQLDKREGAIIIVENGIPSFVRDFRFNTTAASERLSAQPENLSDQVLNEVRISLDYHRRQYTGADINRIVMLTTTEQGEMAGILEKNLNLPVTALNSRSILNQTEEVEVDALYAFGAALKTSVAFPVTIDLAKARSKSAQEMLSDQAATNYKSTYTVAAICGLILLALFGFTHWNLSLLQNEIGRSNISMAPYKLRSLEDIKTESAALSLKLKNYKNVNLKSNMAFFLSRVPQLLSDGMWLTRFNINSLESATPQGSLQKLSVDLEGYAFAENTNQQIGIINQLMTSLRRDENFAHVFNEINLASAHKETTADYTVTHFQIRCQ